MSETLTHLGTPSHEVRDAFQRARWCGKCKDAGHYVAGPMHCRECFRIAWKSAQAASPPAADLREAEWLMLNLASAWYFGGFKAETPNEREMQGILERGGYWPITEAQIIERRALLRAGADNG